MNGNLIILILSLIVLATYIIDVLSYRINIPGVLLLILFGLAFRFFADETNLQFPNLERITPILGTLALILIVLEGSLDLKLSKNKIPLIRQSVITAVILVFISTFSIALIFQTVYGQSLYISVVNALPLAVSSSAIAIPSVAGIKNHVKDFVVYETTFSDVFGIMVFNFLILNAVINFKSFLVFGMEFIFMLIASIILIFFLSFLLDRIKHHIKFFPILALVFAIYAVSQIYHYASLFGVLLFGLFLNNSDLVVQGKVAEYLNPESLSTEIPRFKQIVGELTFVFKRFFFIIFGYSTRITELGNPHALLIAVIVVASIFLFRFLFLRLVYRIPAMPLAFIAPRGLVSILLFLSIPAQLKIEGFNSSILIWTVFLTTMVLSVSMMAYRKKTKKIIPETE